MDRVQWLAVNLSDVTVLALRVSMFLIRHDSLPKSSVQRRITKLLCQLYAHTRACHDDSRTLWCEWAIEKQVCYKTGQKKSFKKNKKKLWFQINNLIHDCRDSSVVVIKPAWLWLVWMQHRCSAIKFMIMLWKTFPVCSLFFLMKWARFSRVQHLGWGDNSVKLQNNEITHQCHSTKERQNSKQLHNSAAQLRPDPSAPFLVSSRNREMRDKGGCGWLSHCKALMHMQVVWSLDESVPTN